MTRHLTFEQISEHASAADARDGTAEARHLAECESCRETLRKVRALVAAARALPRDVEAPPEVWTGIRNRVGTTRRASARWSRIARWTALAATIAFVAVTGLLLQGRKAKATKILAPGTLATATPVVVDKVERTYLGTVAQLRATLDQQRPALPPATVRTVEGSLAVIDTAIAEARQALASDPGNQSLVDILSAHYGRKVELLTRATEISSF